jgi:hypothetical protein
VADRLGARYFEGLGFYMEYLDLPDEALLDAIREAVRWQWDEPLPPEEVSHDLQLADMVLLLGDQSRLWWRDLEGVFAGEEFYVTSLTEWSAISRGAFVPEQIIERWHSDDGPADIEFMVGSQRCMVTHPNQRDEFLNIAIISQINRFISESGYHFGVCDNLGTCRTGWSRLGARRRTHFGASGHGPSSRSKGCLGARCRSLALGGGGQGGRSRGA